MLFSVRPRVTFEAPRQLARVLCFVAISGLCASAGVVTFTGEDLNAGPGNPRPNSDAAAANFATAAGAIGNIGIITFESAPVGNFSSLVVATGVTISGTNGSGGSLSINNAPNFASAPALDGFNTTSGGAKYVEMLGGTLTFTFAGGTQFFGAYLTGVQTNFFQDTVTFNDGTSQTINAPGTGTDSSNGALDFVGFTDAGKLITSVSINAGTNGQDFIGVDDVRYQTAATTVPSSVFLLLAGGALLALRYRRKAASRT
jgi:hypothetical protein